jgi:hypothetical protein
LLMLPVVGAAWILVVATSARGFGWLGGLAVGLCVMALLIATLRSMSEKGGSDWVRRAANIELVLFGVLAAVGGMVTILSEPPPPTLLARILEKMPGRWGERGCQVSMRFEIEGPALRIVLDRPPAGTNLGPISATIVSAVGDELESRATYPDGARSATFNYLTDGVTERLVWQDWSERRAPTTFYRCPG